MSIRLGSGHAEYIAGQLVEPGHELPDDTDPIVLERLRDAGRLIEQDAPKRRKTKDSEEVD